MLSGDSTILIVREIEYRSKIRCGRRVSADKPMGALILRLKWIELWRSKFMWLVTRLIDNCEVNVFHKLAPRGYIYLQSSVSLSV